MAVAQKPLNLASAPCGFRNSRFGSSFSTGDIPGVNHKVTSLGLNTTYKIIFIHIMTAFIFLSFSF